MLFPNYLWRLLIYREIFIVIDMCCDVCYVTYLSCIYSFYATLYFYIFEANPLANYSTTFISCSIKVVALLIGDS